MAPTPKPSRGSQWVVYILVSLAIQALVAGVTQVVIKNRIWESATWDYGMSHVSGCGAPGTRLFYQSRSSFIYSEGERSTNPELHNLESTQWAPLAVTNCSAGMPRYYAPCIQAMNPRFISYAEELIFPDFFIQYPKFINSKSPGGSSEDQLAFFIAELRRRDDIIQRSAAIYDKYMAYRGQHAQNMVLPNASYLGDPPPDSWVARGCMGKDVDFQRIAQSIDMKLDEPSPTLKLVSSALIVTTPMQGSFQHFLDRATHVLEQSAHLFDLGTKAITFQASLKVVRDMYEYYGIENDAVVQYLGGGIKAERMIFSCRALLLHPWYAIRFQERFGIDRHVSPSKRKRVVFLSRAGLKRPLLNEDDLVHTLQRYLEKRKRGEKLVMLSDIHQRYPKFADFVYWMNHNVIAMIGAHGGAFYNHRFAAQCTLLIEIQPKSRWFSGFWEEGFYLRQHYFTILTNSTKGDDATKLTSADLDAIIDTFEWFFEKIENNLSEIQNYRPVSHVEDVQSSS